MLIQDLRDGQTEAHIDTDLCIIGSGPAGLTIAAEFLRSGLRVLVVESGGLAEDPETDSLNEIISVGAPRIMQQGLVRNRAFGGTSRSWSGRCTTLSAMDFAARDWVPFSGWPIERDSLAPYIERAGARLGLGRIDYDAPQPTTLDAPDLDPSVLQYCLWQFSADRHRRLDFMRFGPAFLAQTAADARILLHATVTALRLDASGERAIGAEVAAIGGGRASISARVTVLCAGGIENARILLYSNGQVAGGVGNRTGMVGRFLMDHPRCTLGSFDPTQAHDVRERFGLFQPRGNSHGSFCVRGVALSPQQQERSGLLNCAAWLTEHRAPDDPWDAAKRLVSGRGRRLARDSWQVVSQPRLIARGAASRVLRGRGVAHKLQRLVLDCIVEQRPDPDSRIVLSNSTDRLGLPRTCLNWHISSHERETVSKFAALICTEFKRIGLAVPVLTDSVIAQDPAFVDASHPIGTTRMAESPRTGVVDAQCQVHGVTGLYVAGSSVFPTTGHANPTLTIVALAIRLADHLKQTEFRQPSLRDPQPAAHAAAAAPS